MLLGCGITIATAVLGVGSWFSVCWCYGLYGMLVSRFVGYGLFVVAFMLLLAVCYFG